MPPTRVQSFDLTALPDELRRPVEAALVKPIKLFMDDASRAIERAWSVGDDLLFYEDVRVDVPSDWVAPTFQNSWVEGAAAGDPTVAYRKTEQGDLELRGFPQAPGAGPAANQTIFTVASGFAPEGRVTKICHTRDGTPADASCHVSILSTGEVQWRSGFTAANAVVCLGGIRVACADRQPYQPAGADRWPIDLPYVLERAPLGLFLLEARERIPTGSSATRVPLGGVDWEVRDDRGVRKIRVRRVTGLTPGKSYTLRLVAVGG